MNGSVRHVSLSGVTAMRLWRSAEGPVPSRWHVHGLARRRSNSTDCRAVGRGSMRQQFLRARLACSPRCLHAVGRAIGEIDVDADVARHAVGDSGGSGLPNFTRSPMRSWPVAV